MGRETKLPFKVGQQVEARTFEEGFRGAWFNCRVRGITKKKGPQYLLEYYDFPDEKWDWTHLYQVPPYDVGRGKGKHRELMLRPPYPPTYNEKEMPHVSEISEVTVIVTNSWKVGNLVDWSNSDCRWSGKITQLLGDDMAKIELHPQPFGEGLDYVAGLKDVRPSLDWSPVHGWTIPTQEGDSGTPCARLIKPINQDFQVKMMVCNFSGEALKKQPLENGYGPKYKLREVSAIRDFPPMCGPDIVPNNI